MEEGTHTLSLSMFIIHIFLKTMILKWILKIVYFHSLESYILTIKAERLYILQQTALGRIMRYIYIYLYTFSFLYIEYMI